MDDKDFLASLDEGLGEKAPKPAAADNREQDEIQKLLDGELPAAGDSAAGSAAPPAEPPEPTSVLEMLRQASEAITPEDKPKPKAADPLEADPLALDGADAMAEPPAEPVAPLYETDPEGYNKAQSWLDGEGTASGPGATQGRLRQMRSALRGRPGEEPAQEEAAAPEAPKAPKASEDPLEKLRLARERLRQTEAGKAPEPKRIPAQPRDAVKLAKEGWQPSKADRKAARKAKRGVERKKAAPQAGRPRGGGRSDQRSPEGWQGRVAMLICLLLAGAAVQITVMGKLGIGYSPRDLATGMSAVFPVFFIMLAVRPAGFGQWAAVVLSCTAIVVVGSAAYGLSLWLGRVGPLADAGLSVRMSLILGLYLLCWGPLFLFVVTLLGRMGLWPDDRVKVLVEER